MDVYGRPARRQRIISELNCPGDQRVPGLSRSCDVAPARPLFQQHPEQQRQNSWLPAGTATRLNFAAADAHVTGQEEVEDAGVVLAPTQLPPSRWLACCYKAGQLGVAAFDRLSNELSVMQVPDDNKGALAFQMLHYVKLQVNPQVIVLPATAEAALLEAAQAPAAAAAGAATDGDSVEEVVVQLQRPSIFTFDKALKMLSAISLRQQHAATSAAGRPVGSTTAAADCINLGAQQQVAALGALVTVLMQAQQEDEGTGSLLVDNLTEMRLDGHLLVDGPSLAALDIFKEEGHPSVMGIGTSKEGVSVYGLLQRCVTAMGKRLLRQWFLRPVVQLDTLASRHDTIELLLTAPDTNQHIRAALQKVGDLPRLLAQLRLSQARPRLQAFKQLSHSIDQLMQLQQVFVRLAPAAATAADGMQQQRRPGGLEGRPFNRSDELEKWRAFGAERQTQAPASPWDDLALVKKLLSVIGPQLAACGSLIGDVLDLASPPAEGCFVLPGVCEALDQLKATHAALPEVLTQVVESELLRVPASVARRYSRQLWSVVYIPQIGFVISVTGGRLPEELAELLPDYNLAFMGEDGPAGPAAGEGDESPDSCCAYYYCDCTQQLNSQYGDLQHKIQDLEASICTELIKRLLEFGPCLAAAAAAVAELDCLTSFAAAARELGYVRPTLTQDNVLIIEAGRHPLTELLADGRFIPNDTRLGAPSTPSSNSSAGQEGQQDRSGQGGCGPRMLLITGPNASGKSVYMKQVALIVYMAHVGSFVPAKRAVVGLTDRIVTRLPGCNLEAVSQHTSSFMTDLSQVSTILHRATSRSLILLDEFGKGTLTSDGVGLLAAILQHYAAQPMPPMLLACTHFVELLAPDILPPHPQLHFCTMQVLLSGRGVVTAAGQAQDGAAAAAGGGGGDDADLQQDGDHVFLYKLVQGRFAASYGLNCARICGVDNAVLVRAGDVMALHQAGHAVTRLQLPQLEQRDEQYWKLVKQLAALDVRDEAAVKRLLGLMMAVEAGGG